MVARARQSKQPYVRFGSPLRGSAVMILAITIHRAAADRETGTRTSFDGGSETSAAGQVCNGKSCAAGETCCADCNGKSFCSTRLPRLCMHQDATSPAESGRSDDVGLGQRSKPDRIVAVSQSTKPTPPCQRWLDDNCCAEEHPALCVPGHRFLCQWCPAPPTDACLGGCFRQRAQQRGPRWDRQLL